VPDLSRPEWLVQPGLVARWIREPLDGLNGTGGSDYTGEWGTPQFDASKREGTVSVPTPVDDIAELPYEVIWLHLNDMETSADGGTWTHAGYIPGLPLAESDQSRIL